MTSDDDRRPATAAVALGAAKAEPQSDGAWVVLLDPAGHPFCITPHTPPPHSPSSAPA